MIDIEELKRDWQTIITKHPNKAGNAIHFLTWSHVQPDSVDGGTITFKTGKRDVFESFSLEWIRASTEDIINGYYTRKREIWEPVKVVCLYAPTPEEERAEQERQKAEARRKKQAEEEAAKEKERKRIDSCRFPSSAFNSMRFEDFIVKTDVQRRAFDLAKEFCWYPKTDDEIEAGPEHRWSILFHGPCGTGKTHLALSIGIVELIDVGMPVIFWNVPELLLELRRGFQDDSYFDLLDSVKFVDVLILDDWGMQKVTDWALEQMDSIIEYRYREQMDTIVTTNLSFKELQPRVRSRLAEGVPVCMTGEDYRLLRGLGKVKKHKHEAGQ